MYFVITSDPNCDLEVNEIKAYFRNSVSLEYNPNMDEIGEVQIGGTIRMKSCDLTERGNAVYNNQQHIEQITKCLNDMVLVEAAEDELPNKSPDSYVQYYDNVGVLVKNLVIYGRVFIEDVKNSKLYRIKKFNTDIIRELESLDFD